MLDNLFTKLVMWILHRMYMNVNNDIMYIRGTGADYPVYLLYTENQNVYKRMEEF